jgi:hypothetical protein
LVLNGFTCFPVVKTARMAEIRVCIHRNFVFRSYVLRLPDSKRIGSSISAPFQVTHFGIVTKKFICDNKRNVLFYTRTCRSTKTSRNSSKDFLESLPTKNSILFLHGSHASSQIEGCCGWVPMSVSQCQRRSHLSPSARSTVAIPSPGAKSK